MVLLMQKSFTIDHLTSKHYNFHQWNPELPEETASQNSEPHFNFVDEHMLKTPPIAVEMVKKEIIKMSEVAIENYNLYLDIISKLDFTNVEKFKNNENQLNYINHIVEEAEIRLNEGTCTPVTGAQYLELANNSERVADHIINVGKTIKAIA